MIFQNDFVNDLFTYICSYMQQLISNTNSSPEDAVEYVHGHPVSKLTEIRQAACVKLHKAVL